MSALSVGIEIAGTLFAPLAREIAAGIEEGLDEGAATKRALERLQATPLPEAVLPRVQKLLAEARAKTP